MKRRLAEFRLLGSLLWEYFLQYLKMRVSYRGDFLISVATSLAASLFALGFVLILITRIPSLGGWSIQEIIFLYGFAMIPYGLFNILSLNLYEFGNAYIMEGKFDRVLLRPVSSLFQILFENFRIESFSRSPGGCSDRDMDGAETASALDSNRHFSFDPLRGVRRRNLRFLFPDADHIFILV